MFVLPPAVNCSFVDVPIASCGSSSPMRVALQASAPDMLLILLRLVWDDRRRKKKPPTTNDKTKLMRYIPFRSNMRVFSNTISYGADPRPQDGGTSPVIAILDKLMESEHRSYVYQLVSCLRIILSCLAIVEMPFRVRRLDVFDGRAMWLEFDNRHPTQHTMAEWTLFRIIEWCEMHTLWMVCSRCCSITASQCSLRNTAAWLQTNWSAPSRFLAWCAWNNCAGTLGTIICRTLWTTNSMWITM